MGLSKLIAVCLCLLAGTPCGRCGVVLSVLMPGPLSHLFNMKKVSEAVASRGHTVQYLVVDTNADALQPTDIPILTYSIPKAEFMDPAILKLQGPVTTTELLAGFYTMLTSGCNAILSNDTLMTHLREYDPELMLAETFSPCAQIMASKLDVPFVNFHNIAPVDPLQTSLWRTSNRNYLIPNPIAYLPQHRSHITTQYMSFLERLHNFLEYWRFHVEDYIYLRPIVQGAFKRFGVDPDAPEERRRMVMTLNVADFAIEWRRPLPPNYKMIGSMLPEPARPLPDDLEAFMEGSGENGVLLVSTGTIATMGPKEQRAMAASFAKLPVHVLWVLSTSEAPDQAAIAALGLGNNTKVVNWLPQNDVLGHPRTKAFLSHCGINGLYEAAYHGVPIAALPFLGEQPDNSDKAVGRGMALRLYHEDIGRERFAATLTRILTDRSFMEAARWLSVKLRARPRTPTQEAADWVEHVLATGGEAYLHTPDHDLPFLVRHSVDVWAACLGATAVMVYLAFLLARIALAKLSASRDSFLTPVKTNGHSKNGHIATDPIAKKAA